MADSYTIVNQVQVQAKDLTGSYVPAVRVTFTLGAQGPFYVDVPVASFTAAEVKRLIDAYASHLSDVARLGTTAT